MPTPKELEHWFTHHPPKDEETVKKYAALRNAGLAFAEAITANTPPCADQMAALRKVREAVMTANAAIACEGR